MWVLAQSLDGRRTVKEDDKPLSTALMLHTALNFFTQARTNMLQINSPFSS